ncbi:RNA polymerase sigma factor [Ornithinibacillus bavariensis]|uniref:DNA-directed RNA polymerase sigma-70 factor n=1 Tax=Ornithinibacillus bavariensis TaxID=545502 RepID=A0A919XDX3_9BACI|nr:RNA polymerase sigma factor [Ornithinibacillus bavariensis]GIO28713.1 DNA-directed RNA polymerase sigma-70 factor [Ornithinibacillus bavariensis]
MNTINLSEVYSMHYNQLFHLSYSITRDVQLAEDAVQETFIKVWKKANSIQDDGKISAWLSVVAKRTAIDILRSERKKQGIPMENDMLVNLGKEMNQDVEQEVEFIFFMEEIRKAILRLGNTYRDVMVLLVKHELKGKEIASQLKIKPASVKTRIYRARKELRALAEVNG